MVGVRLWERAVQRLRTATGVVARVELLSRGCMAVRQPPLLARTFMLPREAEMRMLVSGLMSSAKLNWSMEAWRQGVGQASRQGSV